MKNNRQLNNPKLCPLCKTAQNERLETRTSTYFVCFTCDLHFQDPQNHLNASAEKERYLLHNNDPTDIRYQDFVRPALNQILERCPPSAKGLDFGAGKSAVLTRMLRENNYHIELYDPFFWTDESVLQNKYDFVCACEVVEHFFDPAKEFSKLKQLLQKNGVLVLMTLLKLPEQDFASWYYIKDPTHVVFYSAKTFQFIVDQFGFAKLEVVSPRLVVLSA